MTSSVDSLHIEEYRALYLRTLERGLEENYDAVLADSESHFDTDTCPLSIELFREHVGKLHSPRQQLLAAAALGYPAIRLGNFYFPTDHGQRAMFEACALVGKDYMTTHGVAGVDSKRYIPNQELGTQWYEVWPCFPMMRSAVSSWARRLSVMNQ